MFDPHEHANLNHVTVDYYYGLPNLGEYYPNQRAILLQTGLDTITERCVLTHELGHHHYQHRESTPRAEHQADRWAATKLINPTNVVECGRVWPDNPEQWCRELGVTERILRAWLRDHNNQQLLAA